MTDIGDKIKTSLTFLGYDFNDYRRPKLNTRIILFNILELILLIDCFLYLIDNWDNIDRISNSLKGLIVYTLCFSYFVNYLTCWKDFLSTILITVRESKDKFPFPVSKDRKMLLEYNKKELIFNNNILYTFIFFDVILVYILPLSSTIYILLNTEDFNTIKVENLPLLYPAYYPCNYRKLYVYFVWYTLQCLYITFVGHYAYVTYSVCTLSMERIVNDIKLLCLLIREMLTLIPEKGKESYHFEEINSNNSDWIFLKNEENDYFSEDKSRLMKNYLRYIIIQHQLIYK